VTEQLLQSMICVFV